MPNFRIEKLAAHHEVADFDCGEEPLNVFLAKHALQAQRSDASTTYVVVDAEKAHIVCAYYTLAVGDVAIDEAPDRLVKGLPNRPVPIMLLARLATDRHWQKQGLGKALLKDAMQRTLAAADIAGIRAIAVHAKHETAKAFYLQYDFIPSPFNELHLFMLLKDVRKLFAG